MNALYRALFDPAFMPHGHCYLWTPEMVWLQAGSNFLIGLAYLLISGTLWYLVRRVRDLPFQWVYVAFGVFIVTCGFTHFFDVLTIWHPVYWSDAALRVVTAAASVGTAVLLFPLVPKAIGLADAARLAHDRGLQLEQLNGELERLYAQTRQTLTAELEASERRLRATFEQAAVGIALVAPDGRWLRVNRRYCELLGYEPQELETRTFAELTHPDDLATDLEMARRLREGELQTYTMEKRYVRKDGSIVWANMTVSLVRHPDGTPENYIAVAEDITERRRAEVQREDLLAQLQEAVRAREVFLAVAAHELRTPVTPLRLQLESLLRAAKSGQIERLAPDRIEGKLAVALRQTFRLGHLIDRLLDVSRLSSGRLELEDDDFDAVAAVRDVIEGHRPEAAALGIAIELDAPAKISVHLDRGRLDQIVENLLSNAIKFAQGKPVRVQLRTVGDRFELTVADEGRGIPPDEQARIFERFERAAPAQHYPGLGLGLWLVREIVTAMSGSVSVTSQVGEGATFRVVLPIMRRTV